VGDVFVPPGAPQRGVHPIAPSQLLRAQPSELDITTRFPGLEFVVIGALLEMVGYLGNRPWKDPPQTTAEGTK
jgi:hypothetical protein